MDEYILLSVDTVVMIDVSIVRCIDCSNRLVMLGATPPRNTRSPEAVIYMYCNVIIVFVLISSLRRTYVIETP